MVIPEDQQEFMDEMYKLIEAWIMDTGQNEPLDLPKCNPFQRRLLYTNVKPKFPEVGLFLETVMLEPGNKDRFIRISKVDGDQEARLAKEKDEKELQDLKGNYCNCEIKLLNFRLKYILYTVFQMRLVFLA